MPRLAHRQPCEVERLAEERRRGLVWHNAKIAFVVRLSIHTMALERKTDHTQVSAAGHLFFGLRKVSTMRHFPHKPVSMLLSVELCARLALTALGAQLFGLLIFFVDLLASTASHRIMERC